ncbi:MAG TPA: hypothetical protein VD813_04660, partial [Pseudonocardia sp.]|nr:hypothetical protein [Pseudonocardia sp.]
AAPFVVLDGQAAARAALVVLAALPALAGCAIARLRGRSWTFAVLTGVIVLVVAAGIVLLKNALGH